MRASRAPQSHDHWLIIGGGLAAGATWSPELGLPLLMVVGCLWGLGIALIAKMLRRR